MTRPLSPRVVGDVVWNGLWQRLRAGCASRPRSSAWRQCSPSAPAYVFARPLSYLHPWTEHADANLDDISSGRGHVPVFGVSTRAPNLLRMLDAPALRGGTATQAGVAGMDVVHRRHPGRHRRAAARHWARSTSPSSAWPIFRPSPFADDYRPAGSPAQGPDLGRDRRVAGVPAAPRSHQPAASRVEPGDAPAAIRLAGSAASRPASPGAKKISSARWGLGMLNCCPP